jgi:rhodanese-related sulfurtransferase
MSIRNLPPEQVQQLLNDGHDLILIDVREKWEFEICHIDPSINIPMGDIPALAQDLDGDAQTVLICHHGAQIF